jgi:hypothetical protein
MQRISTLVAALKTRKVQDRLGWILLVASFLIGCSTLALSSFTDEGANLIRGLLMTRGYTLYGNLFSNHFPFAYYWAAAVIGLFGKSIMAVRLSVWLFQIASFAIAMKLSRYVLPLGLMSLIWGVIRHIYSGNLILYFSFSTVSLVVVCAIVLAVLLRTVKADWRHSLAIGLFSTIAVLSDPLTIYPVAIALAYLFVTDRKQGFMAGLFLGAGLAFYVGCLLASGLFQGFMEQAVLFNYFTRDKYKDTNPVRFGMILQQAIKGLEILDPRWLRLDPFQAIPYNGSDGWLFTGFFYRLAIIVATLLLLLEKRFRAGTFFYLFACASLLNGNKGFRATSFILLAFFAASAVITGAWWKREKKIIARLQAALGVLLGLMVFWLGLRVAEFTFIQSPEALSYDSQFGKMEARGEQIKEMACGRSDVLLARYPGASYTLWFTDMKPVARFINMYPPQAELYLDEVISALDQEQVAALVFIHDRDIWGEWSVRDYLQPLYEFLDNNYVTLQDGVYVSPSLAAECHEQAPSVEEEP